ncbi:hypothetical protein Fleli_3285 [Bernardetia litoralis DSM 6794]|uniref:MORN repeat protein n=1 Tax=Bernardetia litoralis (strain ATCC 23117 / DSM 6794 / NBRC 15988 / NCIMB 1366 / Fx l1 / Sio-4) TaxID=880071 RepID=I4ANT0_BERLS|nr:hypothetical protein [Bernardetia litoralis]AFM05615.1 hypothetical protein Fleli_3285 [Bernardetia litoralis DSM 6794]
MKKIILCCYFSLFLFFSISAQDDLELFLPLSTSIEKITAVQYSIYKGDTTSENFFEFNFDNTKKIIKWEYFTYHMKEELQYDSLDRIKKIDGLYGESFSNGIVHYYYPSTTQKIEIHDKMGFYKYIKSDFIFDDSSRVVKEMKYDSTFDKMEKHTLVEKINLVYVLDEYGNKVEELCFADSMKELVYEMKAFYKEGKLQKQTKIFTKNSIITGSSDKETKQIDYIKKGIFKGKIVKKIDIHRIKNKTTKNEIHYSYKKVDSLSTLREQKYFVDYSDDKEELQNTTEERKYFVNGKPTHINIYFYRYGNLIAMEEYSISKEDNQEPKLSAWTEYKYTLYKKFKR